MNFNVGENFIERNEYFTDFVRIDSTNKSKQLLDKKNWENGEKKSEKVQKDENNMKDNDINIEKLATKLNLFQNYNHCRNANLSKNNSFLSTIIFNENKKINNIKIEKENSNLLLEINKKNSLNHSFSNISKISSPNTRIYSGNIINNFNNVNINLLNFDKNKMNNILYQKEFSNISYKEYKYNKEGMSVMSPFNSQDKDNILYKQIFFHFDHQKIPEILSKSINNKFNILYAENEKQFDSKAMIRNKLNKKKGKRKIILIGKSENVKKAESINHKINFIKKIFDYAYPDIFIRKMKHETNCNKDINLKRNRKIIENLKKKILEKKYMLSNSVLIEKL